MPSRIKPKGRAMAEFYAEDDAVRVRYLKDVDDWTTVAYCRTLRQAQRLAELMNQQLQAIENNG